MGTKLSMKIAASTVMQKSIFIVIVMAKIGSIYTLFKYKYFKHFAQL